MKYSSSISSKGQVTVPQEVRNRLGLVTGDRVEFALEGESTVIRPLRDGANPFEKYKGALKGFRSRKELKSWMRELREDES